MSGIATLDLESIATGRTYRVWVRTPDGDPPADGWRVLLVIDGNHVFPLAAAIAPLLAAPGQGSMMVVGVGYPTDDAASPMALRTRDLTPEAPVSAIRRFPGSPPPRQEDYGGAAPFREFLAGELRPAIGAGYGAHASDWTLYGHSLGGLFVLDTLFGAPASYKRFVAASPSIWWNGRAVLAGEHGFSVRMARGAAAPDVMLSVGGLEEEPPTTSPSPEITLHELAALTSEARMVRNARELAERLSTSYARGGARFSFRVFESEDHMSVLPASVGAAFVFARAAL